MIEDILASAKLVAFTTGDTVMLDSISSAVINRDAYAARGSVWSYNVIVKIRVERDIKSVRKLFKSAGYSVLRAGLGKADSKDTYSIVKWAR